MELSPERKLRAAIRAAIDKDDSTDRELAVSIARNEAAAFAAWSLAKLTALVRIVRKHSPDPAQMSFPFHDLSVHIPLKKGTVEIRAATMGMLRQSEKVLAAKHREAIHNPRSNSMLGRVRRQIAMMQPYVFQSRKMTVEKVQVLIASGVPPAPRDSSMSDTMKRYWEAKSPEERAAIARRREIKKRRNRMRES